MTSMMENISEDEDIGAAIIVSDGIWFAIATIVAQGDGDVPGMPLPARRVGMAIYRPCHHQPNMSVRLIGKPIYEQPNA